MLLSSLGEFKSSKPTTNKAIAMAPLRFPPPNIYSSILVLIIVALLDAHPTIGEPLYQMCDNNSNYTANSTFQSNLNHLLQSLSSNGSASGFSKGSIGRNSDQVNGLVLCRGDTNATSCRACLDVADHDAPLLCPNNKGAIIWYDHCLLRYSYQRVLTYGIDNQQVYMWNPQNATDPGHFNALLGELMGNISGWAAYNSSRRFATGEIDNSVDGNTIYGLAQCTADLSADQCRGCLQQTYQTINKGLVGARVLGVWCNMRYEVYSFYDGKSTLMLPSSSSSPASNGTAPPATNGTETVPTGELPSTGKKKNETGVVLAIAIPLVIALTLISTICICFWRRSTKKFPNERKPEEITSVESLLFDLSTLRIATDNFSEVNKIGQGGFGSVYKGILPDGQEIAVKRLSTSSSQGLGELKNELVLVAKLQHRNLVRLLGVCLEEQEKLLVYEFVSNSSLDTFIFDPIKCKQLNWGSRYKIIGGIARGLLYLHEDSQLKIIHRDLKASNILLDADMNPKISDFGMARLFGGDQTQGSTSRVVGTFGYMAPEYAMHGHISIKSDVFSFGVLILEIITGRKNTGFFNSENDEDLLNYTWEHWTKGTISEIIDPSLGEHCPISEVLRCIQIGLLSVQEDMADRPNMSTVVLMLNSYSVSIQAPSRPAFCNQKSGLYSDVSKETKSVGGNGDQSSSKSIPMSPNEVSITELEPR